MAAYLHAVTRARFAGSALRSRIPFISRSSSQKEQVPAAWDLAMFTTACSEVAASRELDARGKALGNRLLVEANEQGFPLAVLGEPIDGLTRIDWRQRYAHLLTEVLDEVEKQWTRPTGVRRVIQGTLVFLADWVPPLALLATLTVLLARFFDLWGSAGSKTPDVWTIVLLPLAILLAILVILHLLIYILLPLRWDDIRDTFHKRLEERVEQELAGVYLGVPGDVAARLEEEKKRVEKLIEDTSEVSSWLDKREQTASVTGLYGD
jgi:hypothetical protein